MQRKIHRGTPVSWTCTVSDCACSAYCQASQDCKHDWTYQLTIHYTGLLKLHSGAEHLPIELLYEILPTGPSTSRWYHFSCLCVLVKEWPLPTRGRRWFWEKGGGCFQTSSTFLPPYCRMKGPGVMESSFNTWINLCGCRHQHDPIMIITWHPNAPVSNTLLSGGKCQLRHQGGGRNKESDLVVVNEKVTRSTKWYVGMTSCTISKASLFISMAKSPVLFSNCRNGSPLKGGDCISRDMLLVGTHTSG